MTVLRNTNICFVSCALLSICKLSEHTLLISPEKTDSVPCKSNRFCKIFRIPRTTASSATGMDSQPLKERFEAASKVNLRAKCSNDELLPLYGLYKQVRSHGDRTEFPGGPDNPYFGMLWKFRERGGSSRRQLVKSKISFQIVGRQET